MEAMERLETGDTQDRNLGGGEEDLHALLQENATLQSQYDRAISKALNTARGNWEKEQSALERERQGQLTAEQERAFNEREQMIAMRERRSNARAALGERNLPVELADCLRCEDDDSLQKSLDAVEKAFSAQVQRVVRERLKGTPPKGGEAGYANQMRAALGLKQ